MARTVIVEFPDDFYRTLEAVAVRRQKTIEDLVADTMRASVSALDWEYGEFTEQERQAMVQTALERDDLWGSEGDRVWDTWKPSSPAT